MYFLHNGYFFLHIGKKSTAYSFGVDAGYKYFDDVPGFWFLTEKLWHVDSIELGLKVF